MEREVEKGGKVIVHGLSERRVFYRSGGGWQKGKGGCGRNASRLYGAAAANLSTDAGGKRAAVADD